jgi:hypothetical protein
MKKFVSDGRTLKPIPSSSAVVFLRSHLNRSIFRLYPYRFTVVPIALWVAAILSQWVFVLTAFVAFWWDVYHSSLQTFGLGRIYDQRIGNDPTVGRRADYLFNLVIYSGPIFAGAALLWHLDSFKRFGAVDATSLVQGASVLTQLGSQRTEEVHRVELRLVLEHGGSVAGERGVERVPPRHVESE